MNGQENIFKMEVEKMAEMQQTTNWLLMKSGYKILNYWKHDRWVAVCRPEQQQQQEYRWRKIRAFKRLEFETCGSTSQS